MRTTAISNNLILIVTTRGPMTSQFKFLPTNLTVQARDGNRSGRPAPVGQPAGRVAGRVEILRPAGQAG